MGLALDEPRENERPMEVNGIDVLIGEEVRPFASGNVLDYVESPAGSGFVLGPESGYTCC